MAPDGREGAPRQQVEAGLLQEDEGREGRDASSTTTSTGEYRPGERAASSPRSRRRRGSTTRRARLRAVLAGKDKAAELAWRNLRDTLIYAFNRVPEIARRLRRRRRRHALGLQLGARPVRDARRHRRRRVRQAGGGGRRGDARRALAASTVVLRGGGRPPPLRRPRPRRRLEGRARGRRTSSTSLLLEKAGAVVERNAGASVRRPRRRRLLPRVPHQDERHRGRRARHGPPGACAAPRPRAGARDREPGRRTFSAGANLALLAMAIAEGAYDEVAPHGDAPSRRRSWR